MPMLPPLLPLIWDGVAADGVAQLCCGSITALSVSAQASIDNGGSCPRYPGPAKGCGYQYPGAV